MGLLLMFHLEKWRHISLDLFNFPVSFQWLINLEAVK